MKKILTKMQGDLPCIYNTFQRFGVGQIFFYALKEVPHCQQGC